jgi:hypothetical protein
MSGESKNMSRLWIRTTRPGSRPSKVRWTEAVSDANGPFTWHSTSVALTLDFPLPLPVPSGEADVCWFSEAREKVKGRGVGGKREWSDRGREKTETQAGACMFSSRIVITKVGPA